MYVGTQKADSSMLAELLDKVKAGVVFVVVIGFGFRCSKLIMFNFFPL